MRSMAAVGTSVASRELLRRGLELLQEEDPRALSSAEAAEGLRDLSVLINQLQAQFTRRVAEFDRSQGYVVDDAGSMAAWLRHQVRLSYGAASEQVRVSRQLQRVPEAEASFSQGRVSFQHCSVMTRLAEDADPQSEGFREAAPHLVEAAERTDPYSLAKYTRHIRHALAPEAFGEDDNAAHERRRLHLSQSLDGRWFLDGVLDNEGGALVRTALDAVMGPPGQDDHRQPGQRRADALVDLGRRVLDAGELPMSGGQRPHVTVTADVATLAKLEGSPAAELDWGMAISGETVRRLACDCTLTPVLVDERGNPLSMGRAKRTFSGPQRRVIAARDGGCAGCGRPVSWCSGHHLVSWIDGGPTDVDNGVLLCPRCHRQVHEGGYRLVRKPDGGWAKIPPRRWPP